MGKLSEILTGDIETERGPAANTEIEQRDLSIYTITRKEDQHYLKGMLDSLPSGVECVIVNTVHNPECEGQLTVDRRETIDGMAYVLATYCYKSWDFAEARNAALKLCSRSWCFWMDTDDRLLPFQHETLLEICDLPPGVGGVYVGCFGYQPPYQEEKRGAFYATPHCRAHRNIQGLEWRGKVHEQIEPQLKDLGFTTVEADLGVYHVGYVTDKSNLTAKMGRNVIMLCQQIATDRNYLPDYYLDQLYKNLHTFLEMKGQ